jgi:hypothetical protein
MRAATVATGLFDDNSSSSLAEPSMVISFSSGGVSKISEPPSSSL